MIWSVYKGDEEMREDEIERAWTIFGREEELKEEGWQNLKLLKYQNFDSVFLALNIITAAGQSLSLYLANTTAVSQQLL